MQAGIGDGFGGKLRGEFISPHMPFRIDQRLSGTGPAFSRTGKCDMTDYCSPSAQLARMDFDTSYQAGRILSSANRAFFCMNSRFAGAAHLPAG